MKYLRGGLLLAGLAVVLLLGNVNIMQKQAVLDEGETLLLRLRPVDPRSLIQGDYMVLRYDLAAFPEAEQAAALPWRGSVILARDEDGVGRFARLDDGGALQANEVRLRYKLRVGWGELRYGAESFFFQEGDAEHYATARYGVLRLDESGDSVLAGLADEDRKLIRVD
jgi:uncharacterized membrane-anchored protein